MTRSLQRIRHAMRNLPGTPHHVSMTVHSAPNNALDQAAVALPGLPAPGNP